MISGVLTLQDGAVAVVRDHHDFTRLIEEYCGYEAAQMCDELARMTNKAAHLAETDFAAYEVSLDAAQSVLRDISDSVSGVRKELEKPRGNKAKVLRMLDRIDAEISNHL